MLADFCLRLGCGLIACLFVLSPAQVQARFYRVQFLTALGLAAAASIMIFESGMTAGAGGWLLPCGLLFCAFLGSLAWSLNRVTFGRIMTVMTTVVFAAALVWQARASTPSERLGWVLAGDFASALLLGAATTAMLMGHSYLIAPAMSLTPLLRLIGLLCAAIAARAALAGVELWFWTGEHSLARLNEVTLLLPVRWLLGFVAPAILGVMAWRTARMRSTQSATGILYVVVIFCFLGELFGLLLQQMELATPR
jgi:hypothetical protein